MLDKNILLLILDGWGINGNSHKNAIAEAKKKNMDRLLNTYVNTTMNASELDVGLPKGQMGNSEVGHLNIGAGRIIMQDLVKIDIEIENSNFYKNPVLLDAIKKSIENKGKIHIMGLMSDGGIHSRNKHIEAMVEMSARNGQKNIVVHAFLDGRDTPPRSAEEPLQSMLNLCKKLECGRIGSISGRYYSMDRDQRWDRIQKSFNMLVHRTGCKISSCPLKALKESYEEGVTDEFVEPVYIDNAHGEENRIMDGDSVVFMNFRSDRGREMSHALTDIGFDKFERGVLPKISKYVTMTEYDSELHVDVAYPKENIRNTIGEVMEKHGMKQLRIAETEKYAHVTYFINGGREEKFDMEDRILVDSPKDVKTYDEKPEMSAERVTDRLLEELVLNRHKLIICNYANPDMIGHTGNYEATIKAIEFIDLCIGRILDCIESKKLNTDIVIIADHGNADQMEDPITKQPHTAHSCNPVPFIYVSKEKNIRIKNIDRSFRLCDVSPTILYMFGIEKPSEMTGWSIIERERI